MFLSNFTGVIPRYRCQHCPYTFHTMVEKNVHEVKSHFKKLKQLEKICWILLNEIKVNGDIRNKLHTIIYLSKPIPHGGIMVPPIMNVSAATSLLRVDSPKFMTLFLLVLEKHCRPTCDIFSKKLIQDFLLMAKISFLWGTMIY